MEERNVHCLITMLDRGERIEQKGTGEDKKKLLENGGGKNKMKNIYMGRNAIRERRDIQ